MDKRIALIFLLATAFIVLIRFPFLSNVLMGEEGIFGYLAAGPAVLSENQGEALLIGRINGKDVFGIPEHPIVPYLWIDSVLKPLLGQIDGQVGLTFDGKSAAARIPFFLTFCLALAALMAIAAWPTPIHWDWPLGLAVVFYAATTPLMVGGSIQAQVDGSYGVLLGALSALALMIGTRNNYRSNLWLFGGGFIAGLGKNEWAIALFLAVAVSLWSLPITRFMGSRDGGWDIGVGLRTATIIVIGLFLGSGMSYALSPANYLGGIHVMERLAARDLATRWNTFNRDFQWILPVFAVLALASYLVVSRWHRLATVDGLPKLITYTWGIGITFGYMLTSWSGDGFPRYYAPALMVLVCFIVMELRGEALSRKISWVAFLCLALLAIVNLSALRTGWQKRVSITSLPGTAMEEKVEEYLDKYQEFKVSRTPVIVDAAFGYYFQDADFVGQSLGPEGIERFLHEFGDR